MKPVQLDAQYGLFIGGKWSPASDGATFDTYNPANGDYLTKCAEATQGDVQRAVDAARAAFASYRKTTAAERAALLNKIADIIDANKERLATIETMDNGKPIRETLNIDLPFSSDHFRYFAGCIIAEEGSANMLGSNMLSIVLPEPIGVVGQIVPWNFPFLMAAWKLAPVLASGCCTVFKPSSATSLSVLEFAKLVQDVVPPGVFNVITGSGSKAGQWILDNPGFDKLAFTGSTDVGVTVATAAAKRLIPATLELGGKSANIFFEDCDWEKALDGLQLGILFNQGQVCCAGSRVFVQESIYDKFLADAVKRFNAIKVGDPLDESTQMGSQINKGHQAKVLRMIDAAVADGAKVACGGKAVTANGLDKGAFVQPTLLVNVKNCDCIAQEEVFGPVAVVIPFKDEADVVAMANDSKYGLGGAVWTQDINRAIRVSRNIETGRMWINCYNQIPSGAPFGGYKQSGIGRETHKVILDHYCQKKNLMIDLSGAPSGFY